MPNVKQDNIDPQLLEKICILYSIDINNLVFITAVDNNFVFSFQKDNAEYILRGGTRHPPDQVQAELDFVLFLDLCGIKVSVPILSNNERYLELVEHDNKMINVIVFEKAPGNLVRLDDPNEWNEQLWEEMGRILGKLHAAALKFNSIQIIAKRISAFEMLQTMIDDNLNPVKDVRVIQRYNALKNKLQQLPKDNNAYGLIQYDFHTHNFNVHNGEIIVYDFDDSYYFFFMYDLAACIHETIWDVPDAEKIDFANKFVPALWKGYSEEYKLDRKWLQYLPDLLKWREFDIYATLVETYNDKTTPERYFAKLEVYVPEFKKRCESDEQIVPLPSNLEDWFRIT
jgi:Ser/Thr protein kinase RdoA (MazF antagonist)